MTLDQFDRPPAPGIEERSPGTTLVCFSHLRWNFVYQRPQHLLTRASRGYDVLFIEEPVFENRGGAVLRQVPALANLTVATPVLPHGLSSDEIEALQGQLIDEVLAERAGKLLVFWYYTPMALGFTADWQPDVIVYDCMDELSAFRFAPQQLRDRENHLLDRADLVFTGGQSLFEAKRDRHPSVHCFPSAIDAAHFGSARLSTEGAADQVGIGRPRIGYFGVIDERLDIDLVAEVARLRPDWQLVMIGPIAKIDPASLPRLPNVHWLGAKDYDDLPSYLAGWDVGLMPFAMNEATRFISPTKTPEFLAAGVPVVSTPVVDVVRSYGKAGLVEIAGSAQEVTSRIAALLAAPRAEWLKQVDAHLAGMSWDRTWDAMHNLIEEKLGVTSGTTSIIAAAFGPSEHV